MSTYDQPEPGQWIRPIPEGYKLACCDCGLVHKHDYRVVDGHVEFRVWPANRETGQMRRHMESANVPAPPASETDSGLLREAIGDLDREPTLGEIKEYGLDGSPGTNFNTLQWKLDRVRVALAHHAEPATDLDVLRALSEAATPGPWTTLGEPDIEDDPDSGAEFAWKSISSPHGVGDVVDQVALYADAAFIAAAVNYVRSRLTATASTNPSPETK